MRRFLVGILLSLGALASTVPTADAQIQFKVGNTPIQIGPSPNNQTNPNYQNPNYQNPNYQNNPNYQYPGRWNQPGYYYPPPAQPSYQVINPPLQDTQRVLIRVRVPNPETQVWFDRSLTSQTGMERTFNTAPLAVGYNYQYTIRARWMENGQVFDHTRTINMTPGQEVVVDFTRPN